MPMARISLRRGKSPAFIAALADGVQRALTEAFETPADDRFQIIHQHDEHELVFDRSYLGGPRSDGFVLIVITAGKPRTPEVKERFYRRTVELLRESPGIRPEDVMIIVTTTQPDDWSFSGGVPWNGKRPGPEGAVR